MLCAPDVRSEVVGVSFLPRYLIVMVFGAVLLCGVQVPNFVNQYAQRVDAHLKQVQQDLVGFRAVAQRFFHGDIDALIAAHDASHDPHFRAEGVPLREMVDSERRLTAQHAALAGSMYAQAAYIALHGDRALLRETWKGYAPAFLLDRDALVIGAGLAFGVCFTLEILIALLRGIWRLIFGRRAVRV